MTDSELVRVFLGSGISVWLCCLTVERNSINEFFVADIYFHQKNEREHQAALELRDAVLRLRRDGAFVAVPLRSVNLEPVGPHPVGTNLTFRSLMWLVDTRPATKAPLRFGVLPKLSHPYFHICV